MVPFARLDTHILCLADEMLRMGFIDDVEWILEQTPKERQIALFSATMPQQIRRIANRYLNNPTEITIKVKTATAETIRQRFWPVSGLHKLDALTRILEAETFDAIIIFVRTKTSTVDLSEKLEARGYACAALNGDIAQNQRERTIENLKKGKLDIIVATDVAARGLDVKRISHVINYDIPYDTEAYIHRIGRTGRAGKEGDAILFVAPRERRMLNAIERATKKKIDLMELPSTELINDKRIAQFKQNISDTLANEDLVFFSQLIEQFQQEHNIPAIEIAAALAQMLQGDTPFLLKNKPIKADKGWSKSTDQPREGRRRERKGRGRDSSDRDRPRRERGERGVSKKNMPVDEGMIRYRIEVGHDHQVKPGNIVGAIANEAGLDSKHIGRINIYDDHSLIDLPDGMPTETFDCVKKLWVAGQQLRISRALKDDSFTKSEKTKNDKKPKDKNNKDKKRVKSERKPRRTVKKK